MNLLCRANTHPETHLIHIHGDTLSSNKMGHIYLFAIALSTNYNEIKDTIC